MDTFGAGTAPGDHCAWSACNRLGGCRTSSRETSVSLVSSLQPVTFFFFPGVPFC